MMSADAFSAFEEFGLNNRSELSKVGKRYFYLDIFVIVMNGRIVSTFVRPDSVHRSSWRAFPIKFS